MHIIDYLFYSYRYLVPNDLTAYHFNYIIRKRIKLPEKDSLYFFVNGKYLLKGGKNPTHTTKLLWWNLTNLILSILTHLDTLMAHVYEQKKDLDGFLYITYTEETTLGGQVVEETQEWNIRMSALKKKMNNFYKITIFLDA